jgi:hypothetical protein
MRFQDTCDFWDLYCTVSQPLRRQLILCFPRNEIWESLTVPLIVELEFSS